MVGAVFVIFVIGLATLPTSFSDETILVNQQIKISSDFENTKSESQPFAYIVQISNDIGQIISISYITGSLGAGQELEQTLSYIPHDTGNYKVEKFLWSDMNEPTALTVKPEAKIINVIQTSQQQIQETPQQTVQTELTASTSKSSYNAGDAILVTGTASSDYENQSVHIRIINPQGNLISISQVTPNSYNVFSQSITTSLGGQWSDAGVYQIIINHGAKETGTVFNFSGSNFDEIEPPPLPEPEPIVFQGTTTIMMAQGSSIPGCEPHCYIPSFAGVPSNSYVTWENTDTAPHTVTAGDPGDGPSGAFDSSLIMSGQSFSVTLDDGDYPYFCMIHPWRTGVVSVGDYEPEPIETVQELVFSTSKTSYQYGDYIAVTGSWTGDVVPGLDATIQIFYQNNLISISNTNVFNSGFFSETFRAAGPMWTQDGEYTIKVEYGSQPSQQQTFNLSGATSSQDCVHEFDIPGAGTIDVPIDCSQGNEPFPQLGERFDSSLVMPGSSYTTQPFNEPGFVAYFCMVHPWMTGLIIVEDEGADTQSIQLNPLLTPAFAEHALNATVENAQGSSTPGCEPDCFIPSVITIGVGGQVTFMNNDSAAHTATSYLSYFGSDHGIIAPEPLPEPEFIFRFDYPTVTDTFGNAISSISPDQQVDINFYVENKKPDGTSQQFYIWFEENTRVDEPFTGGDNVDWDNENLIGPFTALVDRPQIIQIPWTPQSSGNINNMFKIASVHENFLTDYLLAPTLELERFVEYHYEPVPASGQIAIVENAQGSSTPGCEPDCFIPATVTIGVGGQVKFLNNDSAAHMSTSGTPDGAVEVAGVWDSGLFMPGSSYTTPSLAAGEYPYFCMVHPWMTGLVIVEAEGESHDDHSNEDMEMQSLTASDIVINLSGSALGGEIAAIDVAINGEHVNYDIVATHNGETILDESGNHSHTGEGSHTTSALTADASDDNPIDITVTFQGFGMPGDEMAGPVGLTQSYQIFYEPEPVHETETEHEPSQMEMQTLADHEILIYSPPSITAGEQVVIDVTFLNKEHVNYDIIVWQDGGSGNILNESNVHSHDGTGRHTTSAADLDASYTNPIVVEVKFQGFGMPGDEMAGPIGQQKFLYINDRPVYFFNAKVVDVFGNSLSEVSVDQQVQVEAEIYNNQVTSQPYEYSLTVSCGSYLYGESGRTDYGSGFMTSSTGSLDPGQTINPSFTWIPEYPGNYQLELGVYDSSKDYSNKFASHFLPVLVDGGGECIDPDVGHLPLTPSGEIATVENAQGSSTPGCEPDCFIPATVTIGVGGQVKFLNNDSAAHTSTSGSPGTLDGVWDSTLFMPGQTYTTPALDAGEYPYHCMVHPWMTGLVIVE